MADVLNSGWYILGSELHLFETNFPIIVVQNFVLELEMVLTH